MQSASADLSKPSSRKLADLIPILDEVRLSEVCKPFMVAFASSPRRAHTLQRRSNSASIYTPLFYYNPT